MKPLKSSLLRKLVIGYKASTNQNLGFMRGENWRIKPSRQLSIPDANQLAEAINIPPPSIEKIYNEIKKIEADAISSPDVQFLKSRVENLERRATESGAYIVPQIASSIIQAKEKLREIEVGASDDVNPAVEIKHEIEGLEREKSVLEDAKNTVMQKFYNREIDESSLKSITDNYEQRLVEINIRIENWRKELEKVDKEPITHKTSQERKDIMLSLLRTNKLTVPLLTPQFQSQMNVPPIVINLPKILRPAMTTRYETREHEDAPSQKTEPYAASAASEKIIASKPLGTSETVEGFEIPQMPKKGAKIEALETEEEKSYLSLAYPLIPRSPAKNEHVFAYTKIFWDSANNRYVYNLVEPELNEKLRDVYKKVKEMLEQRLDIDFSKLKKIEATGFLDKQVDDVLKYFNFVITENEKRILKYYMTRDFTGLEMIEPLVQDPNIEDISCDGVGIPIFIFHRNSEIGSIATNVAFDDSEQLDSFVIRLAQLCGKAVSVSEPLLDGTLPDGSRIQATLGTDIARRGSNFCITEGYVQMSDGSIEDIRELFENWKQRYGSRFDEYQNEISVPVDAYAVGAHHDNLEQEKGKVLEILKLPPPYKLVKVSFEENGKTSSSLEVTENHMFHVLTDKGIKTLEANKLTSGLWVPVPSKIEVEGNLSEKDFRNDIVTSLSSFASSKVYIKLNQEMIGYITYTTSRSRLKDIKRGKTTSIPISEFLRNLQLKNQNTDNLESVYCILREGKRGRGACIRIPLNLTEKLAYFVGWVIGDGSLTKDNLSIDTGLNEDYKKSLLETIKELFDIEGKIYKNDESRIYINSKILSKILNNVFEIPYGYKARKVDVPKVIQKSKNKIVANFLKGLFEADGSFTSNINLTTFSKNLATKVIFLLSRLGIYSTFNQDGDAYRIYVPSAYYRKFSVCAFSNEKVARLVQHQRKTKKSHILPTFLSDLILKSCRERGMKWDIISKELNPVDIRKNGKISFRKIKGFNDLLKKYGENDLTKMIDRLLKGDLEFKKISKVEISDNKNKSPVYDISCNPVNFYVGGKDTPLFVHDTIRKFTEEPLTPIHLLNYGTLDTNVLGFLWFVVDYGRSVLVSGGTASGKTSLLNVISLFIRPEKKIVSIEDTAELRLPHPHWVPVVARTAITSEGKGEVDMFELLRESLRQRPDYIVVGEVRGKEAYVLFQQMATGHPSLATIHAENTQRLIDRLTTPPISLPAGLINSLDIVVFLARMKYKDKFTRKVTEIVELGGFDQETGKPIINQIFKWKPQNDRFDIVNKSISLKKVSEFTGISEKDIRNEIERRIVVLEWMKENNILNYKDVHKIFSLYYSDPERLLSIIQGAG